MRAAVVGHVEWIEFVPVEHVPRAGEIVAARGHRGTRRPAAASVAAVQLAQLADSVLFFTALGDGRARAGREGRAGGARDRGSRDSRRDPPQRTGFTYVDEVGERTITTIGPKIGPRGHDDSLPWHELARCDAVYFCAGDVDALHAARRGRVLVATARELATLRRGAVELDALVGQRQGRGRAVPARRSRSRAAARRDDVGRARRLGAAGRPLHRGAGSGAARRLVRRGRLLRRPVSRSRSRPGSRPRTRWRSPRAAAPAPSRARASTRSTSRSARQPGDD